MIKEKSLRYKAANLILKGALNSASATNSNTVFASSYITMVAKWLSMTEKKNLYTAFDTIPDMNESLWYAAIAFSKINFAIKMNDGTMVYEHPALNLLNNPNVLQSKADILEQYYLDFGLFGEGYWYGLTPGSVVDYRTIKQLWILNSLYTSPLWTGKLFNQFRKEDIISGYQMEVSGHKANYETNSVAHIKLANPKTPVFGRSVYAGESRTITTMQAFYESEQVLAKKIGAVQLITPDDKGDDLEATNLSREEIVELQDNMSDFGIAEDKFLLMFAGRSLKSQNMVPKISDLLLDSRMQKYRGRLLDAAGTPMELFSDSKGVTYANKREADRQLYVNRLIPYFDKMSTGLTFLLGINEEGGRLVHDTRHIDALKTDKKAEATAYKQKNDALRDQFKMGAITRNEWRNALDEASTNDPKDDLKIYEMDAKDVAIILGSPLQIQE